MPLSLIEKIRRQYPQPGEVYTVGGALCLYLGSGPKKPMQPDLFKALGTANPSLPLSLRTVYATCIVSLDNVGEEDEAWYLMGKAITRRFVEQEG